MSQEPPWRVYNKCADMFHAGDVAKIAHLKPAGGSTLTVEECEEFVPRIVACVNACCGLSTEELQKIAAWKETLAAPVSADAANILVDLGWKVFDKEGSEWK